MKEEALDASSQIALALSHRVFILALADPVLGIISFSQLVLVLFFIEIRVHALVEHYSLFFVEVSPVPVVAIYLFVLFICLLLFFVAFTVEYLVVNLHFFATAEKLLDLHDGVSS